MCSEKPMPDALGYSDIEVQIRTLNIVDSAIPLVASQLRLCIDDAYERRTITLHQWRILMEETALLQARHSMQRPDGWRWFPTISRSCGNAGNE